MRGTEGNRAPYCHKHKRRADGYWQFPNNKVTIYTRDACGLNPICRDGCGSGPTFFSFYQTHQNNRDVKAATRVHNGTPNEWGEENVCDCYHQSPFIVPTCELSELEKSELCPHIKEGK